MSDWHKAREPLTEADKAAILSIYTVELGVSKTAKRIGRPRAVVDRFLKAQGCRVISNREGRAIPVEHKARIEEWYWEEGKTAEEIGRTYGVQAHVVIKYLKRNGVRVRSQAESREFLGNRLEREIVRRFVSGDSQISVARDYGLNDHKVRSLLKRHGVYAKLVPAPVTDAVRAEAKRLYVEEGWRMVDVVEHLKVHKAELYAFLRSVKISRHRRKYTPSLCDEICARYTSGESVKFIARSIKGTPTKIKRILESRGITIRESLEQVLRWNHANSFLSGEYNGRPFRSSTELSFMIGFLERFNVRYESGETPKWAVPYKDEAGKARTYYPDFVLLDRRIVVEIKPKALWTNPRVVAKKRAAEAHFAVLGFKYQLVGYPTLYSKVIERYMTGAVVFHHDAKFRAHLLVQRGIRLTGPSPSLGTCRKDAA